MRVARAPDQRRLASLLSTGQLAIALLTPLASRQLHLGVAPFTDYGPLALRTLYSLDGYVLVATTTLPDHHAWLVTRALDQAHPQHSELWRNGNQPDPPLHQGSAAYFRGEGVDGPPRWGNPQEIPEQHDHN